MKYFFIVQGEGRGHMTQAISLGQILRGAGHEIVQVVVGKSKQRELPKFFLEKIGATVEQLDSPNFVTDKNHKSVKPFRTAFHVAARFPVYLKSVRRLHQLVSEHQPDVIVNFYDFLGGLYNYIKKPSARYIPLAHQFLIVHPEFDFPRGRRLDRATLHLANRITALGAEKVLALSFQPFDDLPSKKTFVVPPLLRDEVKQLTPTQGDRLLIYMVNPGYGEEVDRFHQQSPEIPLDCFWDKKGKPETWVRDETLTYHQLDDKKFIEKMAECRGYVTTAGFESVCEAMYLGKPVMMVPVQGHYEQACNAVDAEKAGAGIPHDKFEIQKLVDYLPHYQDTSDWFRDWADRNKEVFLKHLA